MKKALAALEPFLNCLDGIVELRERGLPQQGFDTYFSRDLLQILKCINGDICWDDCDVGPRELLGRLAEKNFEFASTSQQNDAHELMEALINIVSHDLKSVAGVSTSFSISLEDIHVNNHDEVLTAGIARGANKSVCQKDLQGKVFSDGSNGPNRFETQTLDQGTGGMMPASFLQPNNIAEPRDHWNRERKSNFREPALSTQAPIQNRSIKREFAAPTVPFDGWIGSALRCSKCKYIRPIRNAPFLSIPLVPGAHHHPYTSGSTQSHLPVCSLEPCLSDFTNVELVEHVECPQCTILEEMEELKDEQVLLHDAIHSMEKRCQRKGETPTSYEALRRDLSRVENRLGLLEIAYPDDVYATSHYDDDIFGLPLQGGKAILRSGALKCLTLTRYPKVLCCHIQRLFVDQSTGKTEKCLQHVQFPLLLDLSMYCVYCRKSDTSWAAGSVFDSKFNDEKCAIYRLKAVIQHIGNGDRGHYVTFREDHRGWFRISDSNVTPVHFAEVRNCQAYMLFYELTVDSTTS